jgi:hypothetical protein
MSGLEKFDSGLQAIFTSYRDVQRHGAENVGRIHPVCRAGRRLYIYLTYDPPLAPIEALGFKTVSHTNERRAFGLVQLKDLEVLAAHPAVRRMEVGTKSKPHLDMSIPDIHANEVRTQSGSGFTGVTGAGSSWESSTPVSISGIRISRRPRVVRACCSCGTRESSRAAPTRFRMKHCSMGHRAMVPSTRSRI